MHNPVRSLKLSEVAEQFKPNIKDNSLELKAKELISFCETANKTVFDNSTKSGRTFEDEMRGTKFTNLNDADLYVLNQVKPYCEHKQLVSNISRYQTSIDTLRAFTEALKYKPMDSNLISNIKRIKDEK